MNKKIIFVVLFLFLPGVLALGIAPGRTTVDFVPGLVKDVSVTILNSEQKDIDLIVSAQGELQDYISFSETTIHMTSDEISHPLNYQLRLPQTLEPGLQTADVIVVELPGRFVQTGEMSVGAAVALLTQVHVNVPYPGKYAEADMNVMPKKDANVEFYVPVFSRGEFTLTSVKAKIEIYNSPGELIATVGTNEVSIEGGGRQELAAVWDASNVASGTYKAKATVLWDEGVTTIEKEFKIGEKHLILENIEVNDFSLGDIAKFEILVANTWGEAIKDVYAEMIVLGKDGNVLASFKSPTSDVSPDDKTLLLAFWDTNGVLEGDYDSVLNLVYEETKEPTTLTLDVKDRKITIYGAGIIISSGITDSGISKGLLYFLIIVIVILVLANISWFMLLRKKLMKK
jgi:hypothetical protein